MTPTPRTGRPKGRPKLVGSPDWATLPPIGDGPALKEWYHRCRVLRVQLARALRTNDRIVREAAAGRFSKLFAARWDALRTGGPDAVPGAMVAAFAATLGK